MRDIIIVVILLVYLIFIIFTLDILEKYLPNEGINYYIISGLVITFCYLLAYYNLCVV